MATPAFQTADAQTRVTLPATFTDAEVIVEVLSASEVLIRKASQPGDELTSLPENTITILSDFDRDRFLAMIESLPDANAVLRRAMDKHRREG